jgi:hypothetical protein
MNLSMQAVIAGLLLGAWPFVMDESKMNGYLATGVFCAISLMVVMPFAIQAASDHPFKTKWGFAIAAGILGGIGLLVLNGMVAKARARGADLGTLFVIFIVAQIFFAATYRAVKNPESFTPAKFVGFAAAGLSAALLLR